MAFLFKVILLTAVIKCCSSSELPKPSYARTFLKVSRSLPGTTEEMKIRTAEGSLATLIVKKRNKTNTESNQENPNVSFVPLSVDRFSFPDENFQSHDHEQVNPLRSGASEKSSTFREVKLSSDSNSPTVGSKTRFGKSLTFDDAIVNKNRQYAVLPHQPILRTNIGANRMINRGGKHLPDEVTVQSEIDVKSGGRQSTIVIDKDGIPVVYGRRVPDDPIDQFQTWRNARVINNRLVTDGTNENKPIFPSFSTDDTKFGKRSDVVNVRQQKNFDWKPETYVLKYQKPQTNQLNNYNSISKLSADKDTIKPLSSYGADSEGIKISPLPLTTNTREPVLQYAHPEFGAQPVKVTRYFNDFLDDQYFDRIKTEKPNFNQRVYTAPISNDYNYHANKYYNGKYYNVESSTKMPIWTKLSEDLKSQLYNGVEKVSQLTKPILNPIMDVTYKGLNSLGLVSHKSYETEKMYSPVVSSSSILIPTLGLVASGAALGLGAVAVGRYFDVNALTPFSTVEKMRSLESQVPVDEIQEIEIHLKENNANFRKDNNGNSGRKVASQKNYLPSKDVDAPSTVASVNFSSQGNNVPESLDLVLKRKKREAELIKKYGVK